MHIKNKSFDIFHFGVAGKPMIQKVDFENNLHDVFLNTFCFPQVVFIVFPKHYYFLSYIIKCNDLVVGYAVGP